VSNEKRKLSLGLLYKTQGDGEKKNENLELKKFEANPGQATKKFKCRVPITD
jgi:hypothetical protein